MEPAGAVTRTDYGADRAGQTDAPKQLDHHDDTPCSNALKQARHPRAHGDCPGEDGSPGFKYLLKKQQRKNQVRSNPGPRGILRQNAIWGAWWARLRPAGDASGSRATRGTANSEGEWPASRSCFEKVFRAYTRPARRAGRQARLGCRTPTRSSRAPHRQAMRSNPHWAASNTFLCPPRRNAGVYGGGGSVRLRAGGALRRESRRGAVPAEPSCRRAPFRRLGFAALPRSPCPRWPARSAAGSMGPPQPVERDFPAGIPMAGISQPVLLQNNMVKKRSSFRASTTAAVRLSAANGSAHGSGWR